MINNKPTQQELEQLWKECSNWVESFRVIEEGKLGIDVNATRVILSTLGRRVCRLVGYYD